jgi:Zn-dependent M28 family amino/carboxypeptidase
MPRKRFIGAALAACAAGSTLLAPSASAELDEVNSKKLRNAVTINGMMQHERAFQAIANANGGTRASGTPGYDASAAYVKARLERAGYRVVEQEFTFPFFAKLAEPTVTVGDTAYETDNYQFSGSGEVTGRIVPALDNTIPPTAPAGETDAGCEPEDFTPASATAPEIALIQRGFCDFAVKAQNAIDAGYDAVIIFNEGQEGRVELSVGTLGRIFDIPVVGLSYTDGAALTEAARAGEVIATVTSSTENDPEATTTNIIGTSKRGDADEQVIVGAHLDSVTEGPGINDNGSGSSQNLEIAEEMAELKIKPRRQLVFAFWGAEEANLLGSQHYVDELTPDQVGQIYANLNFDMTASPNYVRFVYDGDGSDTEEAGPAGSGQLESLFTDYFAGQGLASEPTAFDGRSDYGPFIAVGIPAGGLFAGAEGIKTPEQAAIYGGTAGLAYDPCYHQACDDITNVNTQALGEFADAAAHATLTMARSKSGLFEDDSRVAQKEVRVEATTGADAVE